MAEINYCQNLWVQFAKTKDAHRNCAGVLELSNKEGEMHFQLLRQKLLSFESEMEAMQETWDDSFVMTKRGKLFGPEYQAIKQIEQIIGHDLLNPNSAFNQDIMEDGHVVKLSMLGPKIKDISALGRLTSLKELDLIQAPVEDLTPLNNLSNLRKLSLGAGFQNGYLDISSLKNLVNLQDLGIYRETPVHDISVIASLTGLREIHFNYRAEHDFSAVMNLPNLVALHLGRCPFERPDSDQIATLRERGVHVWFD